MATVASIRSRARGHRYHAFDQHGELIYHTDSYQGMLDQSMRLLSLSQKCTSVTIHDRHNDTRVEWNRYTVHDWRLRSRYHFTGGAN